MAVQLAKKAFKAANVITAASGNDTIALIKVRLYEITLCLYL